MAEAQRVAPVRRRATGTDTVTVACNIPNGLILQVYDVEKVEHVLPNGRSIKENQCTLDVEAGQWALMGPVNRSALAATGRNEHLPDDYRLIPGDAPDTGYALTYGIPRDFWERWLEDNKGGPLIKGHHVFAASSESRAIGEAKEHRESKSGLQGLNQGGDYRVPNGKSIRKFERSDNRTDASVGVEEPEEVE